MLRLRHRVKLFFYRWFLIENDSYEVKNSLHTILKLSRNEDVSFSRVIPFGSPDIIEKASLPTVQKGIQRRVLELSNAHIVGQYGLLLTSDHKLLTHRLGGTEQLLTYQQLFRRSLITSYSRSQDHFKEIYTTHCRHASNYFHWILEFLAGLEGYEKLIEMKQREIPILLQMPYHIKQRRWLELIGYPVLEIEPHQQTHYTADRVYFSTNEFDTYHNLDKVSFDWLRKRMLKNFIQTQSSSRYPKKIFINRKDSEKNRGADNISDIEATLIAKGFVSLTLAETSVDEQIALFKNAEIVVGEHGAGLADVLFCDSCRIIEIFPYNYHNNDIAVLGLHGDNSYSPVFGYREEDGSSRVLLDDVMTAIQYDRPV